LRLKRKNSWPLVWRAVSANVFSSVQNNYSRIVLSLAGLGGLIASYFLVWKNQSTSAVNFIDGDPEYYYYYLQATFSKTYLPDYEWLKPGTINTITHHPAGLSVLLLPFYLLATLFAVLFNFSANGLSLPYQISISLAGLSYALIGLFFLIKFFKLQGISDRISNLIILLLFFGTTLFQYSIVEPAMSHVYSFAAISVFLYFASMYANTKSKQHLTLSALTLGIILLIRPNNVLIVLFVPFLFASRGHFMASLKELLKQRTFYYAIGLLLLFVIFQLLVWMRFENTLFSNRYVAYGFDWLHPHLKEVVFGFEAGLFVYTPLAFIFLFGLFPLFRENRFKFLVLLVFLVLLIYFFSAYSAYTYFDGLGIRVLVDYFAVFAFAGAKLFTYLTDKMVAFNLLLACALFLVVLNVIYSYQSSSGILLRAGMNFEKWKYVFLKTSNNYKNCLGGMNDYPPYSGTQVNAVLSQTLVLSENFNFSEKEFGAGLRFDSLTFYSNRIFLNISCTRSETKINSSNRAFVCVVLEDGNSKTVKSYFQFKLNETPSETCCESKTFNYSATMQADIKKGDNIMIYIWNSEKQNFTVDSFSAEIFNYNYQIATP
jgi:hypothetical protein